ncbi:PTS transporter subunit EIIC, partial [Escherichia coli]
MKQKKAWSFFQSLGKAFMYPIALLSVCGMMLGLGSGLASDDMAKLIPFLAIPIIKTILDFIVSLGLFAFVNLPVLFAIAIPGNDSNLLIVFYVQIMPDDFVMQLHR